MHVSTVVSQRVEAPIEKVYAFATSLEGLGALIKPTGPLPGVTSAVLESDGPLKEGSVRRVTLSDGSKLREQVVRLTKNAAHYYSVTGFSSPFSLFVRDADARWTFIREGERTTVEWRYEFRLTNALAAPAAALLVKVAMRKLMSNTLRNLARAADEGKL